MQAYVQIALTGDGFCVAAKRAFWLVFRHAADVGALGAVSTLFVWLGKLVIMVTSSFFCYAVLTQVRSGWGKQLAHTTHHPTHSPTPTPSPPR